MMGGLGGAFLTLATTVRYQPGLTNGRGWLAIVILIAGNWKPGGVLIASLIFGFLDAFQLQAQGIGVRIPSDFLLVLPYVAAILALMGSQKRSLAPRWLGAPYVRE